MFNKLKQFNDLRKQANSLKSKLSEETISVDHRGIRLTMDGNLEAKSVDIDRDYLNPDKKNQLEARLTETFNEGVKKAQRVMAQKMRESGDFNIPGLTS